MRMLLVISALLLASGGVVTAWSADLTKVDRAIAKEPVYQSKPIYCPLVFGPIGFDAGEQPNKKMPPAQRGEVANGLKVTLRLKKAETRLKADGSDIEPVDLRLTFANVSDMPIKLDMTVATALCGTRLEVMGPGVMKFTEKKPKLQPDKLTPEAFRVLNAGEEWFIDLPFPTFVFHWELFVLKKPGNYRIHQIYCLHREQDSPLAKGSWTGTVTSNEVVLTVLPAIAREPK